MGVDDFLLLLAVDRGRPGVKGAEVVINENIVERIRHKDFMF